MNFWQGTIIRLRAVEPSDAETFARWDLDSERARRLDFVWPPQSASAIAKWTNEQALRRLDDDTYHWVIQSSAGEPVGSISTHLCDRRNGTFGYGIDVDAAQRGKGFASEAVLLVLRYYFDELRYQKVTVPVHADNLPSIRLHEKLGFQREGTLRRMFFTHGEFVDVHWYGMTAAELHAR